MLDSQTITYDNILFFTKNNISPQMDRNNQQQLINNTILIGIEVVPQLLSKMKDYVNEKLKGIIITFYNNNMIRLEIKIDKNIEIKQEKTLILRQHIPQVSIIRNFNNQLEHTFGFWIYLNQAENKIKIGYGEPSQKTEVQLNNITLINNINVDSYEATLNGLDNNTYLNILQKNKEEKQLPAFKIFTQRKFPSNLNLNLSLNLIPKNTQIQQLISYETNAYPDRLATEINKLFKNVEGIIEYNQHISNKQFGEMIDYNVKTKGCLLHNYLDQNKGKQYIRIGLGPQNTLAPGHQFVLEIWPPGNKSSIHDHAGAYGIVKVLYNKIHVDIYAILSNAKEYSKPIDSIDCCQNQYTWLGPHNNQVHQLINNTQITTLTLQSYTQKFNEQNQVQNARADTMNFINQEQNNLSFFRPESSLEISLEDLVQILQSEFKSRQLPQPQQNQAFLLKPNSLQIFPGQNRYWSHEMSKAIQQIQAGIERERSLQSE